MSCNKAFLYLGVAVSTFVFTSLAQSATLTVDGDLSDWGFSVADNNASTFVPAFGLNMVGLFVEDQDDNAGDGGYVGPEYGGQNYDAEAMAAALQGGYLYLAIVSGQRPDNGFERYSPGDIGITTNDGTFGIEVGGGPGGGAGGALVTGDAGSTYALDGSGYTAGEAAASQSVGSIWFNPSWIYSPFSPPEMAQFEAGSGSHVGDASFIFTRDTVTTQHSIIELAIPLSVLGGRSIASISWYPSCGNDEAIISSVTVPEPSSLALAGAGLLGLVACWRRQTRLPSGR